MVALKKEIEIEFAALSKITVVLLNRYDFLMLLQKRILGGKVSKEEAKKFTDNDTTGGLDFLTSDVAVTPVGISRLKKTIHEVQPIIADREARYAAALSKLEALFDKYPEPEFFNGARSEREGDVRDQNEKLSALRQKVRKFRVELPDAPMVLFPAEASAPACAGGAGCAGPAPAAASAAAAGAPPPPPPPPGGAAAVAAAAEPPPPPPPPADGGRRRRNRTRLTQKKRRSARKTLRRRR